MAWLDRARALLTRTKGEGDIISSPIARVFTPDSGFIPMHWGIGFWQRGYNVLPAGDNSTVEACVWAYVRAIAQLPGYHRKTLPNNGIEMVTTSALSRVLRFPNTYQTRSDFLTHTVRSLLYAGNSYWLAFRNNRNEVDALHWLNPRTCSVVIAQDTGDIFYAIGDNPIIAEDMPEKPISGRWLIPQRDMLHVKLATPTNPMVGETWLTALAGDLAVRGAMGFALNQFFQNASRPSGIISTDQVLTKDQLDKLRAAWLEQSTGLATGGVPILSAGLKFQPLGISNHDSQVVDALKLSDRTIAAVFGVPGVLIGVNDGATFSSTETLMNYWLSNGLGYLLDHIEVAIDQFFALPATEFVEYDTDALMRVALKDRIAALAQGVQGGIYAPNEARAREGYSSAPAGDEPRVQQQVVPLSFAQLGSIPSASGQPGVQPVPPTAANDDDEPTKDAEDKAILMEAHLRRELASVRSQL